MNGITIPDLTQLIPILIGVTRGNASPEVKDQARAALTAALDLLSRILTSV